ncbi:MAG: adenine nucleotide alpha hydrolase [Pseudomonadales bacterium]|nr:adenine nucleotide alpha hydrolase [Pseudomonadales bacterium]
MSKLEQLENHLQQLGPVAVAVSGGVDSMTLAVIAHRVNPDSRVYHALSPAVPEQATARVRDYARRESWNLELVHAGEIDDPDYVANPANRCYFCKTRLYDTVADHTDMLVVSGTNTDDLGDYRPGLIAAEEHNVRHPYVEVDIDKDTLREMARSLGLNDLSELPAAPCLSSRVTTGIAIDARLLPLINEVEQALWATLDSRLALKGIRCRIRPEGAAIQLDTDDEIDAGADYARQAREVAGRILTDGGYGDLAGSITVEPYARGSAFLIDTLPVE